MVVEPSAKCVCRPRGRERPVLVGGGRSRLSVGRELLWAVASIIFFACEGGQTASSASRRSTSDMAPPVPPSGQFQLRQAVASPQGATRPTLESGEDCESLGRSACRGGICLHIGLRPDDRFVCASPCADDEACPDDWRCVPEGREKYCAPPPRFAPHAVAARMRRPTTTAPVARVSDAGVITCSPDGGLCR